MATKSRCAVHWVVVVQFDGPISMIWKHCQSPAEAPAAAVVEAALFKSEPPELPYVPQLAAPVVTPPSAICSCCEAMWLPGVPAVAL